MSEILNIATGMDTIGSGDRGYFLHILLLKHMFNEIIPN